MDEPFGCPGCYKSECVCDERKRARENWELITNTLHPDYMRLTYDQQIQVRRLGDGYGNNLQQDELWDWNHIRDSSAEAKEQMAEKIREFLNKEASPI